MTNHTQNIQEIPSMRQKGKLPPKPQFNDANSLFKEINSLCHSNVSNISKALDVLSQSFNKPEVSSTKATYLAYKLASYDQDLAFAWADGIIKHFVAYSENALDWFSAPQSSYFLYAFNISIGTHRETQLRVIADYVLTKLTPQTQIQLIDHLKIASVIIQQGSTGNIFPSGPLNLVTSIISEPALYNFTIDKPIFDSSLRLFNKLVSSIDSVAQILPEILHTINGKTQLIDIACSTICTASSLSQSSIEIIRRLKTKSDQLQKHRISSYFDRRVYPPMIKILQPMLEHKEISETKKLKIQLRKEKQKTRKAMAEENKARREVYFEKKEKQKAEKDKEYKKTISMLENERNYDLNMAAAAPKEEEDENDDNEVQPNDLKRRDPDIDDSSDSEEDESD